MIPDSGDEDKVNIEMMAVEMQNDHWNAEEK
jgi:hypothetical protein